MFTNREYDMLIAMRQRPRSWEELKEIAGTDDHNLNVMLSGELGKLWYAVEDGVSPLDGTLNLNFMGETVADEEIKRRKNATVRDTQAAFSIIGSIVAILTSIAALIISLAK